MKLVNRNFLSTIVLLLWPSITLLSAEELCRVYATEYIKQPGSIHHRCKLSDDGLLYSCETDEGEEVIHSYASLDDFIMEREKIGLAIGIDTVSKNKEKEVQSVSSQIFQEDGYSLRQSREGTFQMVWEKWDSLGRPLQGEADLSDCKKIPVEVDLDDKKRIVSVKFGKAGVAHSKGCDMALPMTAESRYDKNLILIKEEISMPARTTRKTYDVVSTQKICRDIGKRERKVASKKRRELGSNNLYRDNNEFNYRVKKPPFPWVEKKLEDKTSVAFTHKKPEIYYRIFASELGLHDEVSHDDILESRTEVLRSKNFKIKKSKKLKVNGLSGLRHSGTVMEDDTNLLFDISLFFHNGFYYIVFVTIPESETKPDEFQELATGLINNFELKDLKRISSKKIDSEHKSRYGYTVSLRDTVIDNWSVWSDVRESVEEAEFGKFYNNDGAFIVIPVALPKIKLSNEAVAEAILKSMNIDYRKAEKKNHREIERDGLRGIQFDYSRTVEDSTYDYRIQVVQNEKFAYLISAWVDRESRSKIERIYKSLDTIKFHDAPRIKTKDLSDNDRKTHTWVYNQLGHYYSNNKDKKSSLSLYRSAFEIEKNSPVILANYLHSGLRVQTFQEQYDYLLKYIDRFSDNLDLLSYRAYFEKMLKKYPEAKKNYALLFEKGYDNNSDFTDFIELLREMGEKKEGYRRLEERLKRNNSLDLKYFHTSLLRDDNRHQESAGIHETIYKENPKEVKALIRLMDDYLSLKQNKKAIEAGKTYRKSNSGPAPDIYYLQAIGEYRLKWYQAAKETLEESLRLSPNHESTQKFLNSIAGVLGQGSNTNIKDPIDPVALPEPLNDADKYVKKCRKEKDAEACYVQRVKVIHYSEKGTAHTSYYLKVLVLNQSGVESFSNFRFSFDPLSESIYVNQLNIVNEKGDVIARGDETKYYVMDDTDSDTVSQEQLLNIPVPALKVNTMIDLVVTRKTNVDEKRIPFYEHSLARGNPIGLSGFALCGDVEKLASKNSSEMKTSRADGCTYWKTTNPPVYRSEIFQPDYQRYLPMVWVGDSRENWEKLGAEYYKKIRKKLKLDSRTKKLAKKLTKKAKTRDEKIAIILNYVQKNLTYKALEFGSRGQIPNTARQILKDRYGDCKDHAILIRQLLRAIKVTVNLVLVKTNGPMISELPALKQFNHMIAYLPDYKNGHFVDATDKSLDLPRFGSVGLAGKQTLIIDRKKSYLRTIPDYSPGSSPIKSSRSIVVQKSGSVLVKEKLTLDGYYAAFLRGRLKRDDQYKRKEYIADVIRDYDRSAQLKSLKIKNLYNNNRPLILKLKYRLSSVKLSGEQILFKVPAPWEHYYIHIEENDQRISPVRVHYPLRFSSKISIKLKDYEVVGAKPKKNQSDDGKLIEWSGRWRYKNGKIKIKYSNKMSNGQLKPEHYSSFYKSRQESLKQFSEPLVLKGK